MSEFDKVIGYDSIKLELQRICDIIKNPEKYEKLGVKFPNGLVLHGSPGVGKTLFANCFIKECGVKSFVCRNNKPEEEFINSIKATFDEAKKQQPAVILLDDFDKFANEDKDHKDAKEYVTVQACIDEVKNDKVFVFATANELWKVPDSLIRAGRFDKTIEVKNPKGKDAVKIIEYYLSQKKYVSGLNPEEISRMLYGRSCAELETVINDAAIYAGFANKTQIDMNDIVKACLRLLYEAPETIQDDGHLDDEETAYHEAGHVVLAEVLEPKSVTLVTIGGYEGNISGFAAFYRDIDYWHSFDLMRIRLLTLLAGKAEIELKFGRHDTGCGNDINRAMDVVRRMVSEYGIVGFNKCNSSRYDFDNSPELKARIENAMFDELEKCYMEVKKVLTDNHEFVENLVSALLKKKLLNFNEIQEIKNNSHIVY